MVTGQQRPAFTPEDLRKNFERLQTDLNVVQNELDQALDVWRAILDGEKQEFKKLMEDREQDWARDETQWQTDQQAYRQKIDELETYFKNQLIITEKNAVRALNELDTAWQQERLRWQETQGPQEQRVTQLADENAQLLARVEQIAPLEAQLAAVQAEKAAWQHSLTDHLNQQRLSEEAWQTERQQKDALVQTLQQELTDAKQQLQATDQTQKTQEEHVHVYMNTLETQVSVLEDFVHQMVQPRRRKIDSTSFPPSKFGPPPSRAGY